MSQVEERRATVADGVRSAVPILLAYAGVGVAAGVVQRSAGLTVAEVGLLSAVVYAGAAQLVAAGLLAAGAGPAGIVASVFAVNLRHALYGSTLALRLRDPPAWKAGLVGAQLTDETFTVASTRSAHTGLLSLPWVYGLNVASHAAWITANVAGAALEGAIPRPESLGLDAALPAMFVALLVTQLRVQHPRWHGVLVVAVAAGLVPLLGLVATDGVVVLVAAGLAATGGAVARRLRRSSQAAPGEAEPGAPGEAEPWLRAS